MQKSKKRLNEQGFVSLVVALTLIIILALLTVGFAQLSRREQKQALDKQLAVQANYASESGINDAYKAIQAADLTNNPVRPGDVKPDPTKCLDMTTVGVAGKYNPVINAASSVSYTCLLVDLEPTSIVYTPIRLDRPSRYITFSTSAIPKSFTVQWGSADGRNHFPTHTSTGFLPASTWSTQGNLGVVAFSITPLNPSDRTSLISNTLTTYLYPALNDTSTHPYSAGIGDGGGNAPILSGDCIPSQTLYPCSAQVTGGFTNTGPYLITLQINYDDTDVKISGKDINNNDLHFPDGQAQIDSTGKAQDVLKRLQVRVPLKPTPDLPYSAIEGWVICKRFATYPGFVQFDPPPSIGASSCKLDT
jgi:Tfp pilus assembly protein PilX